MDSSSRAYQIFFERHAGAGMALFDRELRYLMVQGTHPFGAPGIRPESWSGRPAAEVMIPECRERMLALCRDALAGKEGRLELHLGERDHDLQILPVRGEQEMIVGVIVVTQDVTELAASRRTLEERTAWLGSVLEAMDDAVVVMDRDGRIILTNEVGRELVGNWPNASSWPAGTGFFMADQRTPYPLDFLPGAQALQGTRVRQLELFVRSPTAPGTGMWQSINATPLRDANGNVSGAVVVSRDTTILRDASLEILKKNRDRDLLHQIAAAANQWADVERILRAALKAITETTGWPLGHVYLAQNEELVPSPIWVGPQREAYAALVAATMEIPPGHRLALVDGVARTGRVRFVPDLASEADPLLRAAIQAGGLSAGVFVPIQLDGHVMAIIELFLPSDVQGPDDDFLSVLEDAASTLGRVFERAQARAALEHHSEQLQTLSLIDELTGLHNRRGFLTLAEQQRRAGQRARIYHHLIFLDLDGMKGINDQLGHAQGDVALQDTAQLLRSVFRESDILARLGGDEFVVFAASGTVDGDRPILARVREALRLYNEAARRPFKLEISLGATPCDPEHPRSIDELLRIADGLMYEQKRLRKAHADSRT